MINSSGIVSAFKRKTEKRGNLLSVLRCGSVGLEWSVDVAMWSGVL